MATPKKRPSSQGNAVLLRLSERPQLDFELDFFATLLTIVPDHTDALRVQAENLSEKGLVKEGLKLDQTLVQLRPADPAAHYDLACRYARLAQPDLAIQSLRKAVELGYSDFQTMTQDRDLESIRKDPRFHALLKAHGSR